MECVAGEATWKGFFDAKSTVLTRPLHAWVIKFTVLSRKFGWADTAVTRKFVHALTRPAETLLEALVDIFLAQISFCAFNAVACEGVHPIDARTLILARVLFRAVVDVDFTIVTFPTFEAFTGVATVRVHTSSFV